MENNHVIMIHATDSDASNAREMHLRTNMELPNGWEHLESDRDTHPKWARRGLLLTRPDAAPTSLLRHWQTRNHFLWHWSFAKGLLKSVLIQLGELREAIARPWGKVWNYLKSTCRNEILPKNPSSESRARSPWEMEAYQNFMKSETLDLVATRGEGTNSRIEDWRLFCIKD